MRLMRILSAVAVAVCALTTYVYAQAGTDEVGIYKGGTLISEGLTCGGWGSGRAVESKEKVLAGSNSIKITTQGLFSGGRIDFEEPPTLFSGSIDKTRYVEFTLFFSDVKTMDPAAKSNYSLDIEPYQIPKAEKVRFVFVSDTGTKVSIVEPTNPLDPDDNWVRVAVPLEKFKGANVPGFKLKRLLVFLDIPGELYVGDIKLITDGSPMKVDPLSDQTVAVKDDVFFAASADGGISSLQYSWDYDTSSSDLRSDSTGRIGQWVYTRGGDFTVTLTVTDVDGIKAPVSVSTTVSVTD